MKEIPNRTAAYKARSREIRDNPATGSGVDAQWVIRNRERAQKDLRESNYKAEQDKIRSRYVDENEPADPKNYGR